MSHFQLRDNYTNKEKYKIIVILTISHGLEVHLATKTSKSSDSPSSNLKDVDAPGLKILYDCCIRLTPY